MSGTERCLGPCNACQINGQNFLSDERDEDINLPSYGECPPAA